jgi:hypothetical protein
LLEPSFNEPFPPGQLANLRWAIADQSLHLIAHREAIGVAETRRNSEDRSLFDLQLECDMEESREVKAVRGYRHSRSDEVSAERST